MKDVILSLFGGIMGVILTIVYQYFFAPEPTIIVTIEDRVIEVTSEKYEELISENEALKKEKIKYLNDLMEANNKIEELQMQNKDFPDVNYSNLSLSVDGKDIPVNMNNSMITIDGREYISKEIVENMVSNNQSLTIENDTLFVGKIVTEKTSLLDEIIVESENISKTNRMMDSYGNYHTNVLYPVNYHSFMIFNVNRQFSFLRFRLAVQENGYSDAIVTIKADDKIVYTSPNLLTTTEPFEVIDIPINSCSLLTFKIDSGVDGGMGKGFDCIISDPIVYN